MPRIITAFNLERRKGGCRRYKGYLEGGEGWRGGSPPPVALARSERGTRYLAARRGVSSG